MGEELRRAREHHAPINSARLFWDFARLRNALSPEWTIWENVDGALTSNQGMDFALVLGAFVGAGVDAPRGGWARAGVVAGPWGGAVWRVLDAEHFGTPQRRNRVFVVARLGGPCPPEILLEPARRGGDSAPRDPSPQDAARAFGERVAGTLGSYRGHGGLARSQVINGHGAYVAAGEPVVRAFRKAQKAHHEQDAERWEPAEVAGTIAAGGGDANGMLVAEVASPIIAPGHAGEWAERDGESMVVSVAEIASTLTAKGNGRVDDDNLVAFQLRSNGSRAKMGARRTDTADALLVATARAGAGTTEETVVAFNVAAGEGESPVGAHPAERAYALRAGNQTDDPGSVIDGIRRLTATEAERLQGLPDGWTVPYGPSLLDAPAWHELSPAERGIPAVPYDPPGLDTPRRSGCGDAVCATVAEWIGGRIRQVARLLPPAEPS